MDTDRDIKKIALIAFIAIIVVSILAVGYISMNTAHTRVAITCNETIKNGDYITVQLKDDYRNVIPDQVIDLKILDDSGWAYKYNVTTDELGRGYIQVLGLENGNYTVHANFNGTLFLKESHSNFAFAVDDGYSY
ncbi:hypothetical protein [Methanobrevibacter sp.]|uniref:hypothetical protein n=1 Tax=Methanobrevibacter sp. TaxID=66852 RepID=UPI003869AC96